MRFYLLNGHDTGSARGVAEALHADSGTVESSRYANGEGHLRVSPPPTGEHCVLVGSTNPPDHRMLELLLSADTLKKEGASRVTALIPYLGYARHDKAVPGESMATATMGKLMKAAGIDDIVTVDLHSQRDAALIPLPIVALSVAGLFADVIRKEGLSDATVIAPDNGAVARADRVRQEAGIVAPVIEVGKRRVGGKVVRGVFSADVGSKVVVVDDMLDTGETLVSACEMLRAAGAEDIVIMVTHGLFTGDVWLRLRDLGVRRVYCTDTVPLPEPARTEWVSVISVSGLLSEHFSE